MSHVAIPEPISPVESARTNATTASAWLGGLAVLVVASVVRYATTATSGLQIDEAQGVWIARLPTIGSIVSFLAEHESHPPLYYLILRAWMGIFGDSQASAEWLTYAAGLASIAALIAVGVRVFSVRVGLIAGLLMTFSVSFLQYSGVVRPYTILVLLWIASTYALWRALKGGKGAAIAWIGHILAILAMLFLHNWSWIALGGQGLAALCWIGAGRRWRALAAYAAAELTIVLLYAPWLPTLLHQVRYAGYGPSKTESISKTLRYFSDSMVFPGYRIGLPVAALLIAAALICRRLRSPQERQADAIDPLGFLLFLISPLAAFSAAAALSRWTDLVHPHVLLIVAPGTMLGLALAIDQLSGRRGWLATSLGLVVALAIQARYTGPILVHPVARSSTLAAARVVDQAIEPGDVVLVTPQWLESSYDYHARATNRRIQYPSEDFRGAFFYDGTMARLLDPAAFRRTKAALAEARRKGSRVWLVLQDRKLLDFAPTGHHDVDVPAEFQGQNFLRVGHGRALQLRDYLTELYGRPGELVYEPVRSDFGNRIDSPQYVDVYLFAPPVPAAEAGSGPAAISSRGRSR